jgi:hypothetical protein
VVALEADRRGDLEVHAWAAAHRTAQVPGPDLDLRRQRQQPLVQRAEDRPGAMFLVDRQVGTGHVADEERVAGEHGPRGVVAPPAVHEHERGVLGPVPWGVQRADAQRPEPERPAAPKGSWS